MFKIATTTTYTAPVTVELPGSKTKQVFDAEFKRLSQPELTDLTGRIDRKEIDDDTFIDEVLVGWKGVSDEHGEMEFTAANLESLLKIYPVGRCIINAFFSSLAGAKQKN